MPNQERRGSFGCSWPLAKAKANHVCYKCYISWLLNISVMSIEYINQLTSPRSCLTSDIWPRNRLLAQIMVQFHIYVVLLLYIAHELLLHCFCHFYLRHTQLFPHWWTAGKAGVHTGSKFGLSAWAQQQNGKSARRAQLRFLQKNNSRAFTSLFNTGNTNELDVPRSWSELQKMFTATWHDFHSNATRNSWWTWVTVWGLWAINVYHRR